MSFALAEETGVSIWEASRSGGVPPPLAKEVKRFPEKVTSLAYNLSGDLLAAARPDGTILLLGDQAVTEIGKIKLKGEVTRLAFGPKDSTLAALVPGQGLRLFFHHDHVAHLSWSTHAGAVTSCAYQPDPMSDLIALGMGDGSIVLHKISNTERVSEIVDPERHEGPVTALAWQLGGRELASGGEDGLVRLWDTTKPVPRLIASLTGYRGPVSELAYLEGAALLASGSGDGFVKIWEVNPDQKAERLYEYVKEGAGWYAFDEKNQNLTWQGGSGFLTLPAESLLGSWQAGRRTPGRVLC